MRIGRPSFYMPAFTRSIHKNTLFTDDAHIRLPVRNFGIFTDGAVQEGAHSEISKVYRKKLLDNYIKKQY